MSNIVKVEVPDIGDFSSVDIIEVVVSAGDVVAEEDALITLESDKASIEIPSPHAGTIKSVLVKVNDTVSQGDIILEMELAGDATADAPAKEAPAASAPKTETAAPVAVVPGTGSVPAPRARCAARPQSTAASSNTSPTTKRFSP